MVRGGFEPRSARLRFLEAETSLLPPRLLSPTDRLGGSASKPLWKGLVCSVKVTERWSAGSSMCLPGRLMVPGANGVCGPGCQVLAHEQV